MKGRRLQCAVFLILGAFTFVLYSRIYDYILLAQRDASWSFFLFDRQFLLDSLNNPGGLLLYASHFLAQFYEYPWLGALVVAALVVGFGLLLHRALSRLMGATALFCALLPCILLATAFSDSIIHVAVGLMASTAAFLIYLGLPKGTLRRLYALLAIPALYLLAGAYFWLFALWLTAAEWLESRPSANLVWKLLFPALGVATALAAWRWFFLVPLRVAFLEPTVFVQPGYPPISALLLYGYLALLPFAAKASARVPPASTAGSNRRLAAAAAVLALLALGLPRLYYNSRASEFAVYSQLYKQKRWSDILSRAERVPPRGLMTQFFVNCALYHNGRLLDEMFHYPQVWGTRGLILDFPRLDDRSTSAGAMYNSDLFFEMGHINAAFVQAFDNMVVWGRTYENLKRLAECSMVKGHYTLAMEYLTILERTLFHRAYAREYKALLADAKARDLHFAEQRSRLPTAELVDTAMAGFICPLTLLESDPHNRMAFDYLMAWCLLDRQMLPMLPQYVGGLNAAGYRSIPVHLQEALLAVETITGHSAVPPGFNCDAATAARFNTFMGQMEQHPDKLAARRALAPAFSDTHMYYSAFVAAPVARKGALAYWWLANGFRALGRTEEAIAHYQHALWVDPAFAEVHAALADILKSQGRLEEAAYHQSEARRLKASAPNAATPMYSAGSSRVE